MEKERYMAGINTMGLLKGANYGKRDFFTRGVIHRMAEQEQHPKKRPPQLTDRGKARDAAKGPAQSQSSDALHDKIDCHGVKDCSGPGDGKKETAKNLPLEIAKLRTKWTLR